MEMKFYKKITNNMFTTIMEEKKPVVIVFGAEWSGNTSIMDNMMDRVSREINLDVQIYKVDIEKQKVIANHFGISTIPTTIMLKEGEVVEMIKGFFPARKMRDIIRKLYLSD